MLQFRCTDIPSLEVSIEIMSTLTDDYKISIEKEIFTGNKSSK